MKNCLGILVITLVLASFSFNPAVIDAQPVDAAEWRDFLDNLTGKWKLTGSMGSQELHQHCVGTWVLQNNFFQMDCEAISPDTSGYKAKYLIGYHIDKEHYIFHLFDIYGGDYSETLGTGILYQNRISFEFNYPQGTLQNTFVWNKNNESWKMILRQKNENAEWELFSEKMLRKVN